MNYNTGVLVADGQDVIQAVSGTASAAGWNVLHEGLDQGGGDPAATAYRDYVLVLSKGGLEFSMSFDWGSSGSTISVRGFTDTYDSGLPITSQGAVVYGDYVHCSGATCHVFAGAAAVYVAVETLTGSFRHFCAGGLVKNDAYDGGLFISTQDSNVGYYHAFPFAESPHYSYHSSTLAVCVTADGYYRQWRYNRSNQVFPNRCTGGLSHTYGDTIAFTQVLVNSCANQFNRQSILFPIYCSVARAGGGDYSPIGHPPDIRALNIKYLSDKETITLGGDTWIALPIGERNSPLTAFNSADTGIAFLVT